MGVRCGNRAAHGDARVYHETTHDVRECYAGPEPEPWFPEEPGQVQYAFCDRYEIHDRHVYTALNGWTLECFGYTAEDEAANEASYAAADEAERVREAEQAAEVAEAEATAPPPPTGADHPVWDGIYTYVRDGDHYRTFKVRTQDKDAKFAPGMKIISFLSGPDNESNYTGFGFLDYNSLGNFIRVWRKYRASTDLLADADAFLKDPDYALTEAHCSMCHRRLTVPASIHAGLGPECAKKAM